MPTISFDVTLAQAARLQAVVGKLRGLERDATGPEVRQWIIDCVKDAVLHTEKQEAEQTAINAVTLQTLDIV